MLKAILAIVVLGSLSGVVNGLSLPDLLLTPGSLKLRQTLDPTDIPPQCTDVCSPAVNAINNCNSVPTCLCTTSVNQSLRDCFSCLLSLIPNPDANLVAQSQATVNEYEQSCAQAGIALPTLTISVGSSSSTGSGSPSSTGASASSGGSPTSAPTSSLFETDTSVTTPSSISHRTISASSTPTVPLVPSSTNSGAPLSGSSSSSSSGTAAPSSPGGVGSNDASYVGAKWVPLLAVGVAALVFL